MNKESGRFAFFRQLTADNITCMFGNPGSSEENLLDALQDEEFKGFKYYMGLHEGSVVAMADSYARALQRPSIVQLHSYAGLANGLGMMYYAKRGYTPLVIIAGEAGLKYEALDGQMAADLVSMARPFVKSDYNGACAWRVVDGGSLLRLLRRAIKTASTPPMGPVFLALPMDVLEEVNNEPILPSVSVNTDVAPDSELIFHATQLLINSKNPLFLIGDGIAAAQAQDELIQLAEILKAKVYGVNNSEINMPSTHPLYMGETGHMFGKDSQKITCSADVILITGTTVFPEVFPLVEGVFNKDSQIIQFDLNTYEIAKNFPVKIGALANPKKALQALIQEIIKQTGAINTDLACQAKEQNKIEANQNANEQRSPKNEDGLCQMTDFAERLLKYLPNDAIIFDEALTNSPEIFKHIPRDRIRSYYQTRAGMLGTGLPGAIGLKIAYPEKVVLGFTGDGGGISTIQALNTAARYNIGAKFIVCNNRSYRILKYNLKRYWQELNLNTLASFPSEFDLTGLDFVKLAEGQGVQGERIECIKDIEPVISKALSDDKPFLIELMLYDEV